jgi:hypothetical protein
MVTPADAKARATATYNAAADSYDDTANSFWKRFGRSPHVFSRPFRAREAGASAWRSSLSFPPIEATSLPEKGEP